MKKHCFRSKSGPMFRALLCGLMFVLLTALSFSSAAGAEGDNDLIVVGFSQVGAESDWRLANTASMTEALSEGNGFRLIIDDAQNKQERQITAIRNFIQMDVDYIVLAPTNETGWETVLSEAKNAGIPVIIVDRQIDVADHSLYISWVGSDFLKEGREAVKWMDERFGDQPLRIVHLQGNLGCSAQKGRSDALQEALDAHPAWQVVYQGPGDFLQAKGQEIIEDLLSQNVEFDVIYSENDNMAFGAIEALEDAGLCPGSDITIVSFDGCRRALEMITEGKINFVAECNPLHGPRVSNIILTLESGIQPQRLTFVDEVTFDESITQETLDRRNY